MGQNKAKKQKKKKKELGEIVKNTYLRIFKDLRVKIDAID